MTSLCDYQPGYPPPTVGYIVCIEGEAPSLSTIHDSDVVGDAPFSFTRRQESGLLTVCSLPALTLQSDGEGITLALDMIVLLVLFYQGNGLWVVVDQKSPCVFTILRAMMFLQCIMHFVCLYNKSCNCYFTPPFAEPSKYSRYLLTLLVLTVLYCMAAQNLSHCKQVRRCVI